MPAREWKDQDEIQTKRILKVIKSNKIPYMNIAQISEKTDLNRHTVRKYLTLLVKKRKVLKWEVGSWTIYQIKRK